ncbi:MAG: DNA-directed RNA polymerase subunit omega [Phycisphaerales bacterium]|nr:DNA-directed RNA polymerase subunit omega [Phycisphaerales bacterium]MCB9837581.1 DNA-directed RNA polymerase subunit omega [Phycisphaera sp.]
MIEAFKSEEVVDKFGGRFRLTAVIQRRMVQLMEGARPLVERDGRSDLELVVQEILEDKIEIVETQSGGFEIVAEAEEALL